MMSVLVMDALSAMFMISVPIGEYSAKCNLHYADDLLVLTSGGLEDLRIVKLILFLFEGMLGPVTNFVKTCLYLSNLNILPNLEAVKTLNCGVGLLLVTYLGVPIFGKRPRRQDWESLILKVRRRLSAWKVKHLSALVDSVLTALPTYWMSIFKLPSWIIKKIDQIRRDYLWSGVDIDNPGCRLVSWKNLCRS